MVIPGERHRNARHLAKESPLQLLVSPEVSMLRTEIQCLTNQSIMIIRGCVSRGGGGGPMVLISCLCARVCMNRSIKIATALTNHPPRTNSVGRKIRWISNEAISKTELQSAYDQRDQRTYNECTT